MEVLIYDNRNLTRIHINAVTKRVPATQKAKRAGDGERPVRVG